VSSSTVAASRASARRTDRGTELSCTYELELPKVVRILSAGSGGLGLDAAAQAHGGVPQGGTADGEHEHGHGHGHVGGQDDD
jgi:hypothetical protein